MLLSIPKEVLQIYIFINLHPFIFYNSLPVDWDLKYFGEGLLLISLIFIFSVPKQEYSENIFFKKVIKFVSDRIMGYVSKGSILLLSSILFILGIFSYIIFLPFSENVTFKMHLYVLFYSIGTVYFTFSFVLIFEWFINLIIKRRSILYLWKRTMEKGWKLEQKQNKKSDKKSSANHEKKHDFGKKQAKKFFKIASKCQMVLIYVLFVYGFLYPLFCLSITHF